MDDPKTASRWLDEPQSIYERNVAIGSFEVKVRPISITWDTCGCYHYNTQFYVWEKTGNDQNAWQIAGFLLFIGRNVEMAHWDVEGDGCCSP